MVELFTNAESLIRLGPQVRPAAWAAQPRLSSVPSERLAAFGRVGDNGATAGALRVTRRGR
jgi:hypothetical protein